MYTNSQEPLIEILTVSPAEVKNAQEKAAEIAQEFVRKRSETLNGASLSPLWGIFAKSSFVSILREAGTEAKGRFIIEISPSMIQGSLDKFRIELESAGQDHFVRWEENVKNIIRALYQRSDKIFHSYLLGILSDKLFVGQHDADQVICEMTSQGIIKAAGSKYGTPLLEFSGTRMP